MNTKSVNTPVSNQKVHQESISLGVYTLMCTQLARFVCFSFELYRLHICDLLCAHLLTSQKITLDESLLSSQTTAKCVVQNTLFNTETNILTKPGSVFKRPFYSCVFFMVAKTLFIKAGFILRLKGRRFVSRF